MATSYGLAMTIVWHIGMAIIGLVRWIWDGEV